MATEELDHRGGCSCGWRGPWRLTNDDANLDVAEHYRQTGHQITDFQYREVKITPDDDDLMPFERNKKT